MLFSEIYGTYFRTVAAVLTHALNGDLTEKNLSEIVRQNAFGESVLTIPSALTAGDWPLLKRDMTTPLHTEPTMPLTDLQKRWLKSLLLDPRIQLFAPPMDGLENVEPLYDPDVFVYFDRYTDGDLYSDPVYIKHFRLILEAMKEERKIRVRFHSSRNRRQSYVCVPYSIEYSAKDDKFRLLTSYVEGKLFEDYIHDMHITQHFAVLNRKAMTDVILRGMGLTAVEEFTTIHNYIDTDSMILRKGAVSAKAGEKLLIPINMRDGSLICIGKGNEDWNCSAPHGAGRLMSRKTAFATLSMEEYENEMSGIYSTCVVADTLDESPMAYKTMDEIVSQIGPTAEIIERIKPIYNFKAAE